MDGFQPWQIQGKIEMCLPGRIHPVMPNGRYHPSVAKRRNAAAKKQQYLENKAQRAADNSASR